MSKKLIAGLDEVGMGPLAGPLTVVVTLFGKKKPERLNGVMDSKKMKPKDREALAPIIIEEAEFFSTGWVSPWEIDELGMAAAWELACTRALETLPESDNLLVDGNRVIKSYGGGQRVVIKGDNIHWQISAASVLAKVLRDREMAYLSQHYPGYGWETNMGYGTKTHIAALKEMGPTPHHRQSFIKNL